MLCRFNCPDSLLAFPRQWLALLLVFIPGLGYGQGSLTPPGAPAPTMKTLQQVEPRIPVGAPTNITVSGSYYLTGNLAEFAATITTISNSDVTLDLNGFEIYQGDTGIYVAPGLQNVVIRNGAIRLAATGIGSASPVFLEKLRVTGAYFAGANLSSNCIVKDCQFLNNTGSGLVTGDGCVVQDVTSSSNTVSGIVVGNRCVVRDCVASANGTYGISTANAYVVSGCSAGANGSHNITVGFDGAVTHCATDASKTGSGIVAAYGCTISDCAANGNNQYGIDSQQRGTVLNCVASANSQSGIHLNYIGNVQQCVCDANAFCGILSDAGGLSEIINNGCHENGTAGTNSGAGIRVSNASGNRIEGNNVTLNYRGIDVLSIRNILMRNTAAANSNTNFGIVSGNTFGPIVNAVGVGDLSGTANANHPAANFSY